MECDKLNRMISSSAVMAESLGKSTKIRMAQILEKTASEEAVLQRKTRIVCTMGPACSSVETLVQMIDAGMNVCRLNFSHGDHDSHLNILKNVLEAQKQRPDKKIGLMLDTKGPEIRTGLLESKTIELKKGERLKIVTDYSFVGNSNCIACSYSNLPTSVQPGCIILIADGSVSCEVVECQPDHIITKILNNAVIGEKKKHESS